ncbi:MAG: hypothetical protein WBB05_10635 [Mycolicibacterium fortuitum]|uniref:hypothetical protein n=1 Tax=Mycolicibacterium TaxID=1866885 RepID=UPI0009BE4E53|nr:hypothetical protein [Mycolicibacterium fortuitum]
MSLPPQGPPPHGSPWPYGQPPYGQQPPHWPPAQPHQWPGGAAPIPPKKSRLGIAIVAVIAVVGISIIGFMGYMVVKVSGEGQDRIAQSASDFSQVCDNDRISNAAEYGKPYDAVAYYKGLGLVDEIWLSASDSAMSDDFSKINVVACLDRKRGSEVKSLSCVDEDGGDRVTVDYYSVEYEITFREAKSGKVIRSGETVSGTAERCTQLISYERGSRKAYARPDKDAVQAKLDAFAG